MSHNKKTFFEFHIAIRRDVPGNPELAQWLREEALLQDRSLSNFIISILRAAKKEAAP